MLTFKQWLFEEEFTRFYGKVKPNRADYLEVYKIAIDEDFDLRWIIDTKKRLHVFTGYDHTHQSYEEDKMRGSDILISGYMSGKKGLADSRSLKAAQAHIWVHDSDIDNSELPKKEWMAIVKNAFKPLVKILSIYP